jgi:signal transduction histidine kinase
VRSKEGFIVLKRWKAVLPWRRSKSKILSGSLGCLFLLQSAAAQQLKKEEITSAYIFNFAKNIEWQNEDRIPAFRFLIISDDSAIDREMLNLSASQKLRGKPIGVTISESVVIPKDIQLVFITRGLRALTEPVFRRIEGGKILLITDGSDDKRNVMINLIGTKDKTIKFEINKANIINQGLRVLPEMVLLGGTEVDVAKLYKESQDTLRIKEVKLAALQRQLDSLNGRIETAYEEIGKQNQAIGRQNQAIAQQNQAILAQKDQLGKQRDTLSLQSALLHKSQSLLKKQEGILERQQKEVADGKAVLSHQQEKINQQNESILNQVKVLQQQDITISDQENVQRFLILIVVLALGLSYAIYRGYRIKQLSNERLEEQEGKIKKLNRELLERAAALETANKELEAFSYSVSHDLRAPLRSIDGFSQAISEDYEGELDERGKDYLRRVRAAAQRMAHLIDDMLKLSRVARNEMESREIDLTGMAKDIAEKLRKLQPERQAEFIIQPDVKVRGDGRLFRIALENLFNNAWKYTSKHPSARIEFGSRTLDQERVFFIRDDGSGFDMKYAQRLFGAFQRMHTEEEFPGTGVGLAIVQRIIHRHGGKIWAESEVEKGSVFNFSIPLKEGKND